MEFDFNLCVKYESYVTNVTNLTASDTSDTDNESRATVSRGYDYHVIFTWIVGTFLVGALQPIAFELKHLIGCEHGDA